MTETPCGDCPHVQERLRTDFYPHSPEYHCGVLGVWLGFWAAKDADCPRESEEAK